MSPETRRAIRYCTKAFLAVRLGLFLLGFLAATTIPARGVITAPGWPQPPVTPGLHNVVTSFEHQDATWYLRIATSGYKPADGSAAFFPLYPLAIRATSPAVGNHPLTAALLISNLALLAGLILLYLLTASELSESEARTTILYISVFPAAFFFYAPYSESLFFLLVLASFLAARRGSWAIAGIAGALAALTRSVGIFLVVALALEALLQWRESRKPAGSHERWSDLAWKLGWSVVPAAGTIAYLAYWQSKGSWAIPLRLQQYWQREPSWPWMTLVHATTVAWHYSNDFVSGFPLLDWVITIPMLIAGIFALKWFRASFGVFTWLCILAPLSLVFESRPLMSVPRFLLPLFPLFWTAARATERGRLPKSLVIGVSAAGLGLMTVLFVNSYFVF